MTSNLNTALWLLGVTGAIETLILLAGGVYAGYLWATGILPVLVRLGHGLAMRKIAIFAKNENLASLRHLLEDSGLFWTRNICEIAKETDLGRAELFPVSTSWTEWSD